MDISGRLKVTLSIEAKDGGTLLTHEEEFNPLPENLISDLSKDDEPLHLRVLKDIFSLDRKTFVDREIEERIKELRKKLMSYLEEWLFRIKREIESLPSC